MGNVSQNSQVSREFYGPRFAKRFGAEDAPFLRTRSLQCGEVAVTELRVTEPPGRLSDPMPLVDAYTICLMLHELPNNAYWEGGRQVSDFSLRVGETTIQDLKRGPLAMMDKQIHSLIWYLPTSTLHAVADQASVPRISELHYKPGVGMIDMTIERLGLALLPAIRTPTCVNRLFTDYVMFAFAAYAAQTYGGMQTAVKPLKGGLAPWQEKRAKEMIASDLAGGTPLQDVATACGLSVGHFSRAFTRSAGVAPHAWLLQARVETAKAMLLKRDLSLAVIAQSCGFADRSHFTRIFKRHVGQSPGAWRRMLGPGTSE
jgi:AraC family transcriptional regulator